MPIVHDCIDRSKIAESPSGAESMTDCSMFVEDGLAA